MSAIGAYLLISMRLWGFLVLCIPAIVLTLYWLYGRMLLMLCMVEWYRRGFRGIVVTSASPNWSDYIEKQWLSRFGDRIELLNWSDRKKWKKTRAVRVFRHFCESRRNFCPAIIIYRGLHHPYVFRFFYAFRDHKHGNEEALRDLECRLFGLLSIERQDGHGPAIKEAADRG